MSILRRDVRASVRVRPCLELLIKSFVNGLLRAARKLAMDALGPLPEVGREALQKLVIVTESEVWHARMVRLSAHASGHDLRELLRDALRH